MLVIFYWNFLIKKFQKKMTNVFSVLLVPPSFIPALQNIGILHHKKAKLRKHMRQCVPIQTGVYATRHVFFSLTCNVWARGKFLSTLYNKQPAEKRGPFFRCECVYFVCSCMACKFAVTLHTSMHVRQKMYGHLSICLLPDHGLRTPNKGFFQLYPKCFGRFWQIVRMS